MLFFSKLFLIENIFVRETAEDPYECERRCGPASWFCSTVFVLTLSSVTVFAHLDPERS